MTDSLDVVDDAEGKPHSINHTMMIVTHLHSDVFIVVIIFTTTTK
jgi:hypothetical protein